MNKSVLYRFSLLLFILIYMGCAGSSSGTTGISAKRYHVPIGFTFRNEFYEVVRSIVIDKYQYRIARTKESSLRNEIYFETEWKDRPVFPDEGEQGIKDAKTRFIIRASYRDAGKGQFYLHLYADTQIRYGANFQWEPGPLSDMLKEYLDEVTNDLKMELQLPY